MKTVTLSKGGINERTLPLSHLVIPDLWKIAHVPQLEGYSLGGKSAKDLILECWHICHSLKRELEEQPKPNPEPDNQLLDAAEEALEELHHGISQCGYPPEAQDSYKKLQAAIAKSKESYEARS